jgi:superfamily II RNA helicase
MITIDLDNQLKDIYYNISKLHIELDNLNNSLQYIRTSEKIILEYKELIRKRPYTVNKKRKEIDRQIQNIIDNNKYLEQDIKSFDKKNNVEKEIRELEEQNNNINLTINRELDLVIRLLEEKGFIQKEKDNYNILFLGKMASILRETHPLVFSKLIETEQLNCLSCKQLVGLFSCFTNIVISDDLKDNYPNLSEKENNLKNIIINITKMYDEYKDTESNYEIDTGCDYTIHYDLINYAMEWCDCIDANQCKMLLHKMEFEKQIFLGEFVKALLKINNISNEMEKMAELNNNMELLSKLKDISQKTLKFVVTNQSLYI